MPRLDEPPRQIYTSVKTPPATSLANPRTRRAAIALTLIVVAALLIVILGGL